MRAQVIRIGNSRGVRIPQPLLKQCRLEGAVDMEANNGRLIIKPIGKRRAGWDSAFRRMAQAGDDRLPNWDKSPGTKWEKTEWKW